MDRKIINIIRLADQCEILVRMNVRMPEILEERACKHPAEDCGQVPQLKQKKA